MPTLKIILRPDYAYKDGKVPIWLQVFVKQNRIRIPLGISIEPMYFDTAKQIVKKIPKEAELTNTLNAIINKAKEKSNKIFNEAVLYGKVLDKNTFLSEYHAEGISKKSFTQFFETEMNQQGDKAINTIRSYRSTLRYWKDFKPDVCFGELTHTTIDIFDKYLRKKKCETNTLHKHHKVIKKFINLAIAKGNKISNPYDNFKVKTSVSEIEFLTYEEILKLKKIYEDNILERHQQKVLRYYLFSCTCNGLRYSDVAQLEPDNVQGDILVFTPQKTQNYRKTLTVVLSAYGKRLIKDALDDRERIRKTIFTVISNQKTNACMAKIAIQAGINKKCSFHSARHSFATLYLLHNKDVTTLQKILGHANINTTMKYTHIGYEQKVEQMKSFDELFNF